MTSTLDDQQERHYIGNLLCEDDVFGQTNNRTIETNGSGNIPSGNVLPSSEPPPPYSPCSTAPPQWTSIARQTPGLLAPSSVAVPYGQTPTATAVTRTDFYQSSFGGHEEWDNVPGATMNAYMSTGMPYSSHRAVLKSLMTPSNTLDTVQQHHYQSMYRHHQHHLEGSAVDPRIFAGPPPHVYSSVGESGLVHIDSYLPQHLPPKGIKRQHLMRCKCKEKNGGNQTSKSAISAHRISSNHQSTDEALVVPLSCAVSDVYTEQNKGPIHLKNSVAAKKGLAGNQAVDASSRFDVLQSLGMQTTNAIPRRITRRSLSSVVVHHELSVDVAASKPKVGVVSLENIERVDGEGNTVSEDKTRDFNQSGIKPSNFSSTQRNAFKKVISARRELSAHASTDSSRCGRKQRNSVKKRQSDVADYINIMVTLVFSIIKHALQWIMDLLWDISLQLWAITLYAIVAGYSSIVFNCQRCWYSILDAQRKCWESIRLFNIKRMWTNQKNSIEWGLNENIQLPVTGEEAMERILKCRGRDAYMILGLRADCKDDDIKRYYKNKLF
ncbi:hypothetical protein DINM_004606 [Dirofilaria immitis]|nr:hypothetical protein [Dirofilaria immitis]